ncbi:MAG: tRNA pseudouridine(38-40) synthase TruA [Janthinobacterium lividum]
MRTLKLTVEYDGTDFHGYQRQGHGERTVQSVMEETLKRLVPREDITLYGAGRTDIGVHAVGQVISFHTESELPIERWAIALNSLLPADMSVARAEEAALDFHARFSAKQRTYGYLIWTRRTRSALWGRYSLHYRSDLDIALMRAGAQSLIGTRDFAAFARYGGNPGRTTVRDLRRLSVRQVNNGLLVTATASGFLRTMVRNLVGGLIAVGSGKVPIGALEEILATRDRMLNPIPPAVPQGLFLLRVDY